MRTSFADAEDKLLVQIAFQFEREGLRITWDYVARRMKTKHPALQLRLRLASLMTTYGKSISGFPPCFLGGLYSRRLLSAPGLPPPPPRVSQRPARPNRVHSSPSAHVQGLSVRQGGHCDRGDHPAVTTAASAAACIEQSLATGMLMTTPLRASVAQLASRLPQNSKDNKVTVAREQYALQQQSSCRPGSRQPGLCEGRGGRAGPLGLVLALVGLQTALGRVSAAPPGKKVMSIVGQEVVVHAGDLRLGGWQVPTVYQTWCILVAKMEGVLGDAAVYCQHSPKLNEVQAAEEVDFIFGSISANDVRQQAGRAYDNAGEVLPPGVSLILAAVGPLDEADVFLDVGAGVGNILAQVALATDVRVCIGVELRSELVSLGQRCMQQQFKHHPQLDKILLKPVDKMQS
ncbi:hypothetical protein PC118_g20789 [Phytophthora cactorum]|uniref:Histone-lysine N-methyltransferase, H3 lysine-79 specific n=1 Tax=Phytophthora cactorum TaxID=29920 RepID=A0A8T1F1Z6_9STRA|nr:hypothetical protein PC118_g20789 [Phytophthora cactorum]